MSFFKNAKPISISLSPNVEHDDLVLSLKLIFKFWKYKKGKAIFTLEERFKKTFGKKYAFAFNSGRTSALMIFKSLGMSKGDEVLLQAFTCNAAANPIIWAGLNPVYVDCASETLNIDINDLKKKITPKSRAVMVQHTFGFPANMEEIIQICKDHNLVLIEDCAHALGAEYVFEKNSQTHAGKSAKAGTFGKASFFSFSRDKVISSIYGGVIITNDDNLAESIKKESENIGFPSHFWVFQQLLHPVLMNFFILPFYSFLGKYALVFFQFIGALSKAVHKKEKKGQIPCYFPKKMPNALALLVLNQLDKLERFHRHRRNLFDFYLKNFENTNYVIPRIMREKNGSFLRFALFHKNAHSIIKNAWKKNLLIGDWYTSPIAPADTDLEKMKYRRDCLNAGLLAKKTLNLPTHINISKKDAKKIVSFLLKY